MLMYMTPEQERWAETIAIEKRHGRAAGAWLDHRIYELAVAGDAAGVERMIAIATKLDELTAKQSVE